MASAATLFAAPKAFEGHIGMIQRNAITSWCQHRDQVDIFLFGNDPGVAEIAEEFSIRHFPHVERNDEGTPRLDSIFSQAIEASGSPIMMYVNSDIVFNSSLPFTLQKIDDLQLDTFLLIGQRTNFDQLEPIPFSEVGWEEKLMARVAREGKLASILCKDYFVFPREAYREIPAFAIGRGNWDNWMVAEMAKNNSPVIDVTECLFAGHQNHDYTHAGGRMRAYVSGSEARRNKALAGGSNYVSGSVATHRLPRSGELVRANRLPLLSFLRDFPRLARLVYSLFRQ
ncbi:MAG: hypothetical protein VX768_14075 [Planctomycetota bacterium]|nr:hypothetical protein [Planctomycetota bacterium]